MTETIQKRPIRVVAPKLGDPRITLAAALTTWTIFGQTFLYFNRDPSQILIAVASGCLADMLLSFIFFRQILVPISAYITTMSIGILLASNDWRVFAVASIWGVTSKYFLREGDRHFFNPSNFAIVASLQLTHGVATVAAGSQWGGDYRVTLLIMVLGLMMMKRVKRFDLVAAWLGGYTVMSLIRVALGQGGLVFALGPMTGAEFTLFTFSMLPDPKTNPPTPQARVVWGLLVAFIDGVLRYFEFRYSMFYALFALCAALPLFRLAARMRGIEESDPWRTVTLVLGGARIAPAPVAVATAGRGSAETGASRGTYRPL
jgi:Na+-transporting NADH:ubiquinone oxidoreductase subunit NqrB